MLVPGPEPAGPPTGHVHPPDHGVLAADVAHAGRWRRRRSTHQKSAGSPSWNSSTPGSTGTSVPAASSSASWSSVSAVEQAERAEVVDVHQIVAR